jgi:hypothetical protein
VGPPDALPLLLANRTLHENLRHVALRGRLSTVAPRLRRAVRSDVRPPGDAARCQSLRMLTLNMDVPEEEALSLLPCLAELRSLVCTGRRATDAAMDVSVTRGWPRLHRLVVALPDATARNMAALSACRQLRAVTLCFSHQHLDGAAADRLAGALGALPELTRLSLELRGSRLATGFLHALAAAGLPRLRMLHVNLTAVRLGDVDHDMDGMRRLLWPCTPGKSRPRVASRGQHCRTSRSRCGIRTRPTTPCAPRSATCPSWRAGPRTCANCAWTSAQTR